MEDYIEKLKENGTYVEMTLQTKKCPCCGKLMLEKSETNFPSYHILNQKSQMKNLGLVYVGKILVDDEPICVECEEAGKADFLCELCGVRKPSSKIKENIGYPSVFLCSDCYSTVTAKEWDEKIDELHEEHRFDFE